MSDRDRFGGDMSRNEVEMDLSKMKSETLKQMTQ